MRPRSFAEFRGQSHLVAEGGLLRAMIARRRVDSLLLWGPPGCGKTTLARVLAAHHDGPVTRFSAVLHGVRELRELVARARRAPSSSAAPPLVLVDEIHRFTKAQQDAFLPHVEDGTLALLGMTTENPAFAIIAPLLSRMHVLVLEPLSDDAVGAIVDAALTDAERGVSARVAPDGRRALVAAAHGDARVALGLLEAAAAIAASRGGTAIDAALVRDALHHRPLRHDRAADAHYDLLSALIKSMRANDSDAAVYYLARLLEGGEDPLVVARRLVIFAAEDVGLAAPEALTLAVAAKDAVHFVGLPEARIPLAEAVVYLARAPKSRVAYNALAAALEAVRETGPLPVPLHLRNAPTALARALGHGRPPAAAPGASVSNLPAQLAGARFCEPPPETESPPSDPTPGPGPDPTR